MMIIIEMIDIMVNLVKWFGASMLNMLNPAVWTGDDLRAIVFTVIIIGYTNRERIYNLVDSFQRKAV